MVHLICRLKCGPKQKNLQQKNNNELLLKFAGIKKKNKKNYTVILKKIALIN